MRALVQRVSHASVTIDGRIHGQIGQGFLVLLGITDGDTVDDAVYLADKTVKMRVFTDENDNEPLARGCRRRLAHRVAVHALR